MTCLKCWHQIWVSSLVANRTLNACIRKELKADSCKTNNYLFFGLTYKYNFIYMYKIFFKIVRILIERWFNWIMLPEVSQGFILKLHFWHFMQK